MQDKPLFFPFGCPWLSAWCLPHPLMDTCGGLHWRTSLHSSQLHSSWLMMLPTAGQRTLVWLGGVTTAQVLGEQRKAQGNIMPEQLDIDWLLLIPFFYIHLLCIFPSSTHHLSVSLCRCPLANLPWPHATEVPCQPLSSPFSDTGRWQEVRPLAPKSSAFTSWHQHFPQFFLTQSLSHR